MHICDERRRHARQQPHQPSRSTAARRFPTLGTQVRRRSDGLQASSLRPTTFPCLNKLSQHWSTATSNPHLQPGIARNPRTTPFHPSPTPFAGWSAQPAVSAGRLQAPDIPPARPPPRRGPPPPPTLTLAQTPNKPQAHPGGGPGARGARGWAGGGRLWHKKTPRNLPRPARGPRKAPPGQPGSLSQTRKI